MLQTPVRCPALLGPPGPCVAWMTSIVLVPLPTSKLALPAHMPVSCGCWAMLLASSVPVMREGVGQPGPRCPPSARRLHPLLHLGSRAISKPSVHPGQATVLWLARTLPQAAAVEKLLLVTSTCATSPNLPPRPALSMLGTVNENPSSPYMAAPTSTATAMGGQAAQQLPNGQEAAAPAAEGRGGVGAGADAPHGSGRNSAVFRMFMHSEGASPAGAGSGATASGGGEAGGGAGGDGISAEEAAEVGNGLQWRCMHASSLYYSIGGALQQGLSPPDTQLKQDHFS